MIRRQRNRRSKREQNISAEKVVQQLSGSFLTDTGKVIPGHWPEGEMAPVIFDRRYKCYVPVFKTRKLGEPKKKVEELIVKGKASIIPNYMVTWVAALRKIFFRVHPLLEGRLGLESFYIDVSLALSEIPTVYSELDFALSLRVCEDDPKCGALIYHYDSGAVYKIFKFMVTSKLLGVEKFVWADDVAGQAEYAQYDFVSSVSTLPSKALIPDDFPDVPFFDIVGSHNHTSYLLRANGIVSQAAVRLYLRGFNVWSINVSGIPSLDSIKWVVCAEFRMICSYEVYDESAAQWLTDRYYHYRIFLYAFSGDSEWRKDRYNVYHITEATYEEKVSTHGIPVIHVEDGYEDGFDEVDEKVERPFGCYGIYPIFDELGTDIVDFLVDYVRCWRTWNFDLTAWDYRMIRYFYFLGSDSYLKGKTDLVNPSPYVWYSPIGLLWIEGGGVISRVMKRRAYKINGIFYDTDVLIPADLMPADKYPFGRIAAEYLVAARRHKISWVGGCNEVFWSEMVSFYSIHSIYTVNGLFKGRVDMVNKIESYDFIDAESWDSYLETFCYLPVAVRLSSHGISKPIRH